MGLQKKWQAQPPFASQTYERRVAKLQQGEMPLYNTPGRNSANENSAVMISFQVIPWSQMFLATSEQVPDISLITWTSGARTESHIACHWPGPLLLSLRFLTEIAQLL